MKFCLRLLWESFFEAVGDHAGVSQNEVWADFLPIWWTRAPGMQLKSAENLQFYMFHGTFSCAVKFEHLYPWFYEVAFSWVENFSPAWILEYFSPIFKYLISAV